MLIKSTIRKPKRVLAALLANNSGGTGAQALLDGSSFYAQLTKNLTLNRGTGSPTFTRATTATVEDNEGVLRTAIAGEARFVGARRVYNRFVTTTADMSNAAWTKVNLTVTTGVADPNGGTSAMKLVEASGASVTPEIHQSGNTVAGNQFLMWCVAKKAERDWLVINNNQGSGGGSIRAWFNLNTGVVGTVDAGGAATITSLGDSWYLCSVRSTHASGSNSLHVYQVSNADNVSTYAGDGTSGIYIWHPQLEDITGRTDQTTPSEYVSVGVPTDWLGDDLVTNGTFGTDLSGWTLSASTPPTWTANGMQFNSDGGTFSTADQQLTTAAGMKYVIAFNASQMSLLNVYAGTSQGDSSLLSAAPNVDGFFTYTFTATTTTTWIRFIDGAALTNQIIDNIIVKPAIYHGSGVDGVKCFPTDLSGNPISTSTNLGYLAEASAQNLCLQSNSFDTTWVKYLGLTQAQNAIGPDGATSAWTLTDDSAAQTELLYQNNVNLTAAQHTFSIFIKKTSGATSFPVVAIISASPSVMFTVDTNNGVATAWTSSSEGYNVGGTATCVSYNDNFWRASATWTPAAASYEIDLAPAATTNATQSTGSRNATVTGSAVFYGAQVELGSAATSYIPTTTTAVARNTDVESVPTSGNITAAAGWIALSYTPDHAPSGTVFLWGTYVDASNYTAILHDATNLIFRKRIAGSNYDATIANAFVSGTTYKMAASWGASGTGIALNGTLGTPHANTTAAQIAATMQTGADGNGANQPGMSFKNEYIGQRQLSDSELKAITT